MGQAAVPIALAIAGVGVSQYNISRTARKKDAVLAEGIRKTAETERRAKVKLDESLKFAEESRPDEFRTDLNEKFLNAVRMNQARGIGPLEQVGATSDAFKESSGEAAGQATDFAGELSGLFSRIDAAGLQRQAEGFKFGDTRAALNVLRRESRQDDFLTRLRVAGIRPNAFLNLLAAGLGGASSGIANNVFSPKVASAGMMDPNSRNFVQPFRPQTDSLSQFFLSKDFGGGR